MQILKWFNHADDEEYYFDVSDNDKLMGASLEILRHAFEFDMFPEPTPLGTNPMYIKNRKRRDTLLIALNGSTDETFSDMHQELERLNRELGHKEKIYNKRKELYDEVVNILDQKDGSKAILMLADYFPEDIFTFSPVAVDINDLVTPATSENA